MIYTLPKLPYSYDALEPYIDAKTMEVHYTKHHQAYIEALNKSLDRHPELYKKTLPELLKNLDKVPEDIRQEVRNNGGGNYNHSLFWLLMKKNAIGHPVGKMADALTKNFGSVDIFKEEFSLAAKKIFGSGWVWLCLDNQGKLVITSTANQDNPLMKGSGSVIIMGLDVWEHAYYLHYQNRRIDYVQAWWNVVDWEYVEEQYRLLI